ncbi:hypothetical protein QEN19_000674 [Hanseniaspora menglaensis]
MIYRSFILNKRLLLSNTVIKRFNHDDILIHPRILQKIELITKNFINKEISPEINQNSLSQYNNDIKQGTKLYNLFNRFNELKEEKKELVSLLELEKGNPEGDKELMAEAETELDQFNFEFSKIKKQIETTYLLTEKYLTEDDLPENLPLGCILEIRPGVGGSEASIFTKDLFNMYIQLCNKKDWNYNIISAINDESTATGMSEAIIEINPIDSLGDGNIGCYNYLRHETGVHRVQRVPETESKGRMHTSTSSVLVLPLHDKETENAKAAILELSKSKDVRIEVMRSSGKGGQHVNTTNSAVKLTHEPTGITVYIQTERQQHKNKAKAFQLLYTRLKDQKDQASHNTEQNMRKHKVGNVDRSNKIRSYNYQSSRVSDHRLQQSVWQSNDLDGFINADNINKWDELIICLDEEEFNSTLKAALNT